MASLTGCNKTETPAQDVSENQNSSQNSTTYQSLTSSEKSSLSDYQTLSQSSQEYPDLKSDDIIAQFEWPFDDPIDLSNATAINNNLEEVPLSELAEGNWAAVLCDYVYLAEPVGIFYNNVDNADFLIRKI